MTYTPKSFFGRPVAAARRDIAQPVDAITSVDKWHILDALTDARTALGLSHSDLAVLGAVLSFHPTREIGVRPTAIVFASNKALSGRLNGMPDSTMRRHLTRLIAAGIVSRQDSPNGKRYVRRNRDGSVARAFGFDLTPLVTRASEFNATAEQARQDMADLASLRETVSLMRRDLEALSTDTHTDLLDAARVELRRKPDRARLSALKDQMQTAITLAIPDTPTEEMSTKTVQNEQHYQKTDKEPSDLKEAEKKERTPQAKPQKITVQRVVQTCPTIQTYFPQEIKSWHQLEENAVKIAPMIGVGNDVMLALHGALGGQQAAVAILCVLERLATIANPAGYLRKLARKAGAGEFNLANLLKTVEKQAELSADNQKNNVFSLA